MAPIPQAQADRRAVLSTQIWPKRFRRRDIFAIAAPSLMILSRIVNVVSRFLRKIMKKILSDLEIDLAPNFLDLQNLRKMELTRP